MDFSNHFLIAMPSLEDPHFSAAVAYVINHDGDGAMGVVINQPTEHSIADVLDSLSLSTPSEPIASQPVMCGGPVEPQRGIVLHRDPHQYESSVVVADTLTGYAGWSGGQLEREITDNTWLTCPADNRVVFDVPPDQRLAAAAALIGIDLARIDPQSGHA